jgi:flavin reductase (DIM6/NTAB) family NADH-FMN oxidoreductase RutF
MRHFSIEEIQTWERFYRANFINCLTGFKPVSLIGSISKSGVPNLSVVSSIVHLGADPALIGYINRPIAAAPDTITNIKETNCYTINHIQEQFLTKAHQCSAKYLPDVNEFEKVGLNASYEVGIIAPFVKEALVKYEMELVEIIPIQYNQTFFVIGQLKSVFLDESILSDDGFLDLTAAGSIVSLGLDGYAKAAMITRLPYAKP